MSIDSRLKKMEQLTKQQKQINDDPERICNCKTQRFHFIVPGWTKQQTAEYFKGNPERCSKCNGKYMSVVLNEKAVREE